MKAFTKLSAQVIPMWLNDVDTDMIIPAQHLTQTSKTGYGEHLFSRLKAVDSTFVFNQTRFQEAKILVSGANFGCGSSREHAVWALQQAGIEVIIASSFSDIFFNNAAKNGLLLITLDKETVEEIAHKSQSVDIELAVDLTAMSVEFEGNIYRFKYDPFRRECLMKGQDDLAYLLASKALITSYEDARNDEC